MDGEMKYFDFEICGVKRKLPYVKIKEGLALASFVCLSDTELIEAVAPELIKRLPPVDYLMTAEAKGIPLAYEMSRQSGKQWLPARKGAKLYMQDPVTIEDESITTAGKQVLVMDDGRIVLDVKGEERAKMTVEDLLAAFSKNAGRAMENDRILLSTVE